MYVSGIVLFLDDFFLYKTYNQDEQISVGSAGNASNTDHIIIIVNLE